MRSSKPVELSTLTSQLLPPCFDRGRRHAPFPPVLAGYQPANPNQAVQVVEPYPELPGRLYRRYLAFFLIRHKSLLDTSSITSIIPSMQRHTYDAVTVPILIDAPKAWAEGEAYVDSDRVRVREFTEDDADKGQGPGKENWKQLSNNEVLEILHVVNVFRALNANDQLAARNAMQELQKLRSSGLALEVARRAMDDPDYISDSLVYRICREFEGVRLVLWKKEPDRSVSVGLYSPNLRSAFWIHSLMSGIGTTKGFRICPKCGRVFWQDRPAQDYCNVKCREAHRIERWRAKKRAEASVKRGKRTKTRRKREVKRDL